jgi:hypothetical protein
MKNKHLILFAGILVLLAALFFAQKRSSRIDVVQTGIERLLPEQNTEKIRQIRVIQAKGEEPLILKKIDETWIVPNYFNARANEQKIGSFLQDIINLKGERRASNEEVLSTFALEGEQALRVEFTDKEDRSLFVILVGKPGPMGGGCFVRLDDKPDVYLTEANLLAAFGLLGDERKPVDSKLWADLKIMRSSPDGWSMVEIISPDSKVILAKQVNQAKSADAVQTNPSEQQANASPVWIQKQPESPKLEQNQIQEVLNALSGLQGSQLLDPSQMEKYGLKDPTYRVNITLNDDSQLHLLLTQPDEQGPVYAKLDNTGFVYEIHQGSWNNILDPFKIKSEEIKPSGVQQ